MKTLAVIPARGGSKRLPGKNIRDFAGRPILAWPVSAALQSRLFDTVMVSTDSVEIAQAARDAGAETPFMRSVAASDDHATLIDVLAETVAAYDARGERFDVICCILATAALVRSDSLRRGADLFATGRFSSVFPVVRFASPIQRALRVAPDGHTAMIEPRHYATRSQDLEPAYHDAAAFYWLGREACLSRAPIFGGSAGSFEVDQTEAQDIDDEGDWRLAELKHRLAFPESGARPDEP